MGFFGAFFGAILTSPGDDEGEGSSSPPITAPITVTDPEYHDHAQHAVDRLPQYAKARTQ